MTLFRRSQQAVRLLRRAGLRGAYERALSELSQRNGAGDLAHFPLLTDDVVTSRQLDLALPRQPPQSGRGLRIGWVTTPPSLGSGGHTTMFRMVEALERAGHECILYFYDRYGSDLTRREEIFRSGWPQIKAEVRDVSNGITGVDACVATSWPTAHVLARRGSEPMQRFYFLQDYEPYFYPQGSEYALAEDTYRFGFHHIALGRMIPSILASMNLTSRLVEFGCDTKTYGLMPEAPDRRGVVFFARPGVPRRGFVLGCLALQVFHRRHPEEPINVYGGPKMQFDFPATQHGKLRPDELNRLYNQSIAGLGLSFTNITLVADEMLAAGTIPVMNDSPHARAGLDNPFVVWAEPSPAAIATALSSLVSHRDVIDQRAREAAASLRMSGWAPAQREFVKIIESTIYA